MFQAAPLRSRSTTDDDDDEDEEDVSSLLPPGVASPFSSCSPNSPKYPGGGGSSGGGGGGRGGRGRRKGGGGGGRSPKSPRGEGGGLSSPGGGSRGGGGAGLSAVRRPVPPPSFLSSRANSKHRFWELVWPALAKQGWSLEPGKRKRDNDYYFLPPDIDRNTARYRIDYFDSVKSVVAQVAHVPLFEQAVKEFHAAEAHAHQQRLALEQEAAHTAELQREARRRNAAACHAAAAVCHASLSTSSSSSPTSLSSSARSKGVGAGGVWDACSDSYDGEAGRGDATTKRTRVGAVGASPCAVVGRGAQERRIMLQEQQERSAFLSGGGREEEEEEESSFGGDNDGSGCVGDGGAKKKGGGGRGLGSSLSSKSGGAAMVVSGRRTARKVVKFDPSPAGGVSPKQKGLHRNSWSGASGLMASPESSGGSSSNNRKSTGTANTATAKSGSGGGASGGQTPYSWTESACFGNVNQHQLQGYQHQPVPETEACGLVESGTYSLQLESAEEAEAATLAEMHDSSSTVYPLHPAPPPTWTAAAYLGIFGRGNEKEALAADAAACAPPLVPPRPPPPHGGGGAKDKNGVFLELQQQQQQQRVGMESAGTEPLMLAFHKLKRPSSSPRGCGEDDQRTAAAPFARTFGDHEGRAAYVHDKDSRSLALCPGACPGVCPGTTVSVAPTKHMAGNDAPTDPSIAYKVEQHQQIQHFLLQRHQHLSRHGVAQHQPLSQPLGHALGKEQQQPFVVRSQVRLQVPSLVGDGTPPSLSPPPPRFPPKRHAEVSVCLVDEHSRHVHSQEHLQRQQQHFQLQQSDWRQQQQQQQQRQHQQYPEDASTSSLLFKSAQLTPQFEEQLPPALTTPLSSEMGVGGGSEKSESSSSVVVVEDDDAVMAGEAEAGELLGDLFC